MEILNDEKLREHANVIDDGSLIFRDNVCEFISKPMQQLMGGEFYGNMIGKSLEEFSSFILSDDEDKWNDHCSDQMERICLETASVSVVLKTSQGNRYHQLRCNRSVHNETNNMRLFLMFRDVHDCILERNRLKQETLEVSSTQIQAMLVMKDVIKTMIHNWANKLSTNDGIALKLLSLADSQIPEVELKMGIKESAGDIHQVTKDTKNILHNMRSFCERGQEEKSMCNIDEVIFDAASLIYKQYNVNINRKSSHVIHAMIAKQEFTDMLYSLFKNAVEAANGEAPHIEVKAQYMPEIREGTIPTNILIAIEDKGVGIEGLSEDLIFNPKFSMRKKGMGLGMILARETMEKHDGTIELLPIYSGGAVCNVAFPIKDSEIVFPTILKKEQGRGQKILVVEEDVVLAKIISSALKSWGYFPITARDIQTFEDRSKMYEPDLLLMDMKINNDPVGGIKCLQMMKENKWNSPVIIMSGNQELIEDSDILIKGNIQKPLDYLLLQEIVHKALP